MNDQALGSSTPDQTDARPTADPASLAEAAVESRRQLSVTDVLAAARLPEKRAKVCLRADLQARHDEKVAELGTLVNDRGEILDDAETSMGEESATSKAKRINDEIEAVRTEMAKSLWLPLFRGLSSDDLAVFNKEHYPQAEGADLTDYHYRLIARCAVDPAMSVEEVKQLRATLPWPSYLRLVQVANEVNTGAIDVPKSLGFSVTATEK